MNQNPVRKRLQTMSPPRTLNWYDYADAWLDFPLGKVLDYGCGTGEFLGRTLDRCDQCWGVEIDTERAAATTRRLPQARIETIQPGGPLPFEDDSFDTVVILEVIEHVADERIVLQELARVLAPGGRLLLTTPHKGLLTFLDPGNFKFVAPGLHRFIHCTVLRRKEYYERRFGKARKRELGMIADFTTDQSPWHRHYKYREIRALAPDSLETTAWAAYFPAMRAMWSVQVVLKVVTFSRIERLPRPLRWLEQRLSWCASSLGDQLVVLFQKRA